MNFIEKPCLLFILIFSECNKQGFFCFAVLVSNNRYAGMLASVEILEKPRERGAPAPHLSSPILPQRNLPPFFPELGYFQDFTVRMAEFSSSYPTEGGLNATPCQKEEKEQLYFFSGVG